MKKHIKHILFYIIGIITFISGKHIVHEAFYKYENNIWISISLAIIMTLVILAEAFIYVKYFYKK